MSGAAKGRIDCKQIAGVTGPLTVGTAFISLYKAFKILEGAGKVIEVANNWGGGSGFNYHDEASPIGTTGFFVFRIPPKAPRAYSLYILVQYVNASSLAAAANFKINGGTTGSTNGMLGISFAAALSSAGADLSPWAGGTAKLGADAKASPTWAVPADGSKLWIGNRSNNASGSFVATHSDTHTLFANVTAGALGTATRWGVVLDDDNVFFYLDAGDDGVSNIIACVQATLEASITTVPFSHVAFRVTGIFDGAIIGTTSGATDGFGAIEVCVPGPALGSALGTGKIGVLNAAQAVLSKFQPSSITSKYTEVQVSVGMEEGAALSYLGKLDAFVTALSNLANNSTLNLATAPRIVVGSSTVTQARLAFPWKVNATPLTATTRDGIDF